MMYEAMFNIVQDAAMRHQQSGAYVTQEDTVCAICAASQRVYTGISRMEVHNGMQVNVHAEIVAMQQMQAAGENAAESLLMVNLLTLRPMLPCSGCIQYIISQNPGNTACQVVLPDRNIPLGEVGQPAANPYAGAAPAGSMPFNAAVPSGSMYGAPQGSMPYVGAVPVGGSIYGGGSMPYNGAVPGASGSMPYNGAVPSGSVYTQSSQMSQPYAGAVPNPGGHYVGASLPSGTQKAKNSNADYLKNRVGNLMQAADDDDADEDEQETKGLFGRLFGKK